ncbi:PQQ-binding-like beta-propeller repeat protein [Sphingomonas tabacisoli]|uniref:PQQ-binding-like beta-propeller repeat protein n=1 Tax=Sphingomonas tabacisoli TaxID=2249466 RepID=A0ABW4I624_9SPHN
MIRSLRTPLLLATMLAVSGCGVFKPSKPKTPVLGHRIPILVAESGAEVDPALASVEVSIPAPAVNTEWTQPGGNATHSMGNLALSASPSRVWDTKIAGGNTRARLAAAPVVSGGRVYVVDTAARLHALDAQTGREIWAVTVGDATGGKGKGDKRYTKSLFGGGVSVEGDKLFATNGLGDVAAFNTSDGSTVWRKRPGGPLRGAPTLSNGNLYVMSQDNQVFALRQSDGNVEWTASGTLEVSGVFGAAAPAAGQGTVIAGFSSGELNAYRYENGRIVWQDALSRTSISTSVGTISDIDAEPVIDQGRVFAIGSGGRMVSLELVTGQRIWEINAGGIATPAIAGEWLFAVTDDARILCIARSNGKVRWATQLPRWRNQKGKKGAISWVGPVLAGGRLIAVNSRGEIAYISPMTGAVDSTVKYGKPLSLPPVVANNTLYLLDEQGRLTAWR